MKKRTFLAGAVIGGILSSAAALLYAPQSGTKTRRQLQYKGEEVVDKAVKKSKTLCKKGNEAILEISDATKEKIEQVIKK